ncbi:hypothetical protein COE98_12550 [Bacillus wiedmannii]|nr:hypothetical protein [Bacillus wiedmannii]PEI67563.1 hypothetical protein CN646_17855 [Bacillus wiedmannii]PEO16450.1 hypothetical protein CN562_05900 [Bacillus wiedmannii]PEP05331.1 hypothetical protein CN552_28700 [Bacillus wiedmannii]PHB91469.1 hypothetical protein COE98_12550 [Bacillus wiedmannii]PHC84865.1 hypothetical protein COF42_20740 [Bacillus wiedmannii]
MKLWENREKAIRALDRELYIENQIMNSLFELFDNVIESYKLNTPILRVTGNISIKIRALCHGILSLSLDGHAQESGALLRTAIEAYESLVYLRQNPTSVNEFLEDRKPKAGTIAKAIQGNFQEVRNYLSNHSSHFAFKPDSLMHFWQVTDDEDITLKEPPFKIENLRKNLGTLAIFMLQALAESIACLQQNDVFVARCHEKSISLHEKIENVFPNEA